jgi:hypothetical protein
LIKKSQEREYSFARQRSERVKINELVPDYPLDPGHPLKRFRLGGQGSFHSAISRSSRLPGERRRFIHGDPAGHIDWRLYAKTEKLMVRLEQPEVPSLNRIEVDLTDSMSWAPASNVASKWEIALRVLFHWGFHLLRSGNNLQIVVRRPGLPNGHLAWQPAMSQQMSDLFAELAIVDFSADRLLQTIPFEQYTGGNRADCCLYLTDGFHGFPEADGVGRIAWWMHLRHSWERDISWIRPDSIYTEQAGEPSGGKLSRGVTGSGILDGKRYQAAIEAFLTRSALHAESLGLAYQLVDSDSGIDSYLEAVRQLQQYLHGDSLAASGG